MGIQKLMDFIKKKSPNAIKQVTPKSCYKAKYAIDASNTIYQFLIKTQSISFLNELFQPEILVQSKCQLIGLAIKLVI